MPGWVHSSEGLGRTRCLAQVVVVEFALLHKLEAVTRVEAIGLTLTKRADLDREVKGLCLREHQLQDLGADAATLMRRPDVQVIEQQVLLLWLGDQKPDLLRANDDV